jgi:membrane protein implicated in regulation of membrane protease activity
LNWRWGGVRNPLFSRLISGRLRGRCHIQRGIEIEDRYSQNAIMIAAVFLIFGFYLACGLLFAIPFALTGVKKIDPHAAHGSWGFRLLIIPGTVVFWPLLLRRWLKGISEPPEERNAHRQAAKGNTP